MRKIYFKIGKIAATVLFVFLFTGCQDFLETEQLNKQTTDDLSNPESVRKLDIGIYNGYAGSYNYFWPLYLSHCAGEYEFKEPVNEGPDHFEMWNLNPSPANSALGSIFAGFYSTIIRANRVIQIIESQEGTIGEMPVDEQDIILGGAYFMRGLSYFYLLHIWGRPFDGDDKWGVVIHTDVVDTREQIKKARSKPSEVYALIESDFAKAKSLLPDPADLPATELGRPTKPSAIAMLGKTYVFEKKYPEAITEFGEFIQNYGDVGMASQNYKGLLPYYGDNFHGGKFENSIESLFEVQFGDLVTTNPWSGGGTGSHFQIYSGGPDMGRNNVSVRHSLFFDFQKYDIRKVESRFHYYDEDIHSDNYADTIIFRGQTIVCRDSVMLFHDGKPYQMAPYKYSNKTENSPKKYINRLRGANNAQGMASDVGDENQIVLRVSEVYFLYAEALLEGGGDLNKAIELVNKVTRRAYGYSEDEVTPYDYNPGASGDFKTYLMAEKRKEFIGEQVRWFDMVRWGIAEQECALTGRVYTTRVDCWPMPNREVAANPLCEQAPGY
jgi:tetratricopeptide (TPR) repeat protein